MTITDVRVRKVAKDGKMKAVVSITLAEQLAKEHIVHVMQNLKKIEEKHNQEEAKDGKN